MIQGCWNALVLALATCLLLSPGYVNGQPPEQRFNFEMRPPEFLYVLVDFSSGATPAFMRRQGGIFTEDPNPPINRDHAWRMRGFHPVSNNWVVAYRNLRHVIEAFAFCPAVPRSHEMPAGASRPGFWIYMIAASPHMIDGRPQGSSSERGAWWASALGGIFWSQVNAYAWIADSDVDVNSLEWQNNRDYDSRWENYGVTVPQYLFNDYWHRPRVQQTLSAREIAMRFMAELTGPENSQLNAARRQTLQELLDWNLEAEPRRSFPLVRYSQPDSLATRALQSIDWFRIELPFHLRMALAGGLPTLRQCSQAYVAVRNHRPPPTMRKRYASNCEDLAALAGEQFASAKNDEHRITSLKPKDILFMESLDFYICEGAAFGAPCTKVEAPQGQCVAVPDDYKAKISSVLPGRVSGNCNFYVDPDCKGDTFQASYPGVDLAHGNLHLFSDKIQSIQCKNQTTFVN
ncbi:hypothetical protein XA68_14405 [Ophiocordyceps unilateralis]|uniref:Enterotoxin n=1 Tax=Ophiocordyceps unilateralis TaxID=268505 RepID=A0A2A9PM30_OPHUN|nr:hypothetical protein XA68_14405 [Ophiocordyceps unilateralis]